MDTGLDGVPVVDTLGFAAFTEQLLDRVDLMLTALTNIVDNTAQIYAKLSHVEIDSYVNVRVVDEFGVDPLPATVATGLLVSAFANGTFDVNVLNTTLDIAGTVNAHNMYLTSSGWKDAPAAPVDTISYFVDGTRVEEPLDSCVPLSGTGGVWDAGGAVIYGAIASVTQSGPIHAFAPFVNPNFP